MIKPKSGREPGHNHDPGPCAACGIESAKRTTFDAQKESGAIIQLKLCRECTKITLQVQANLAASRRLVGYRG